MPNGNLKAMLRQNVNISKIDTIIISHVHADHCFDIPFVLWYKKRHPLSNDELPIKIITEEVTKKTVEALIELLKEYQNLKIIQIHMHDETREQARKLNIKNLIILEDGYILEL